MRKVILAAIQLDQDDAVFEQALQECERLCEACGYEVCSRCVQKSRSMDKHSGFRSGKLEELKALCEAMEADFVVFLNNLSVSMSRAVEAACGCEVIDRTTLILDIFSLRAQTREAKLQTELARLEYSLPRLVSKEEGSERQRGGGVNNRGAGESRGAVLRRNVEHNIQDIKKELKQLKTHQELHKSGREGGLRKVALVGYTNAGKSSLMNELLKRNHKEDKQVLQKDMLFATLDTSVRHITHKGRSFLLYDTVGFVSDLPHELVEAFRSTLDACREADLLVHVQDVSNPLMEAQRQITIDTLKQIGADEVERLDVWNKVDLVEEYEGIGISCLNGSGIEELLDEIVRRLYPAQISGHYLIPYEKLGLLEGIRPRVELQKIEESDEGIVFAISGMEEDLGRLNEYRMER